MELRAALKPFYGVLKSVDAALRFVMLTGVTRFSKVSIFSDLNQLNEIGLARDYAAVCGITETELLVSSYLCLPCGHCCYCAAIIANIRLGIIIIIKMLSTIPVSFSL